jgi:hypothetical protein
MSAIRSLQKRGEEIEFRVGPASTPGIADAEKQDVRGGEDDQDGKDHHQAASV